MPESQAGKNSAVLYRDLNDTPLEVIKGIHNEWVLENGHRVVDASCGAAVTGLGHTVPREIRDAINEVLDKGVFYVPSAYFTHSEVEEYARKMIESTGGEMARVQFFCSGTEGVESALKLAIQYHQEAGQPERKYFIGCWDSYHGNSITALAVGGHQGRRKRYVEYFSPHFHHVSRYNAYRGPIHGESSSDYVARLIKELEDKIEDLGARAISAYIIEPVAGAALGCMPYDRSYLEAVRELCNKNGILLIFDETMCGIGRTGTLHAWQYDGVVPDIQVCGKGLTGGVVPLSALIVGHKVVKVLKSGSGQFSHGHTFQNHPLACTVGSKVLDMVPKLIGRVVKMGDALQELLKKRIGNHAHVGDIRGRGLFVGIEFVKDKTTKVPFDRDRRIAEGIFDHGISREKIFVYACTGWANGLDGDGIIIAPALTISEKELAIIVWKVGAVIEGFFRSLDDPTKMKERARL